MNAIELEKLKAMAEDGVMPSRIVLALLDDVERLQAIVDKLPKYADTGKPVVLGNCYAVCDGEVIDECGVYSIEFSLDGDDICFGLRDSTGNEWETFEVFETIEAAAASAKGRA